MDFNTRRQIRDIIEREVVVATGCTEPGAVALCVTKAREVLGCMPDNVRLLLSRNVYKNAMGVGIPGTGMVGLPIAVAIGLVAGNSEKKLEVLTVDANEVEKAKQWLSNNAEKISIEIKESCPDKLYIECLCDSNDRHSRVIIEKKHSNFAYIANEKGVICDSNECIDTNEGHCNEPRLSVRTVYDYATQTPIEELMFIRETVQLNKAAADEGLKGYGLNTGRILLENANNDLVHTVIARTVAASDARMDGCTMPIYSNSGSGNQGIACTLPVYEYGIAKHCDEETITRALIFSHLMSIYVKKGIGRLSALCGIVNASIGVSCAMAYLCGATYDQICYSVKNMINTLAGMVCDGAKPSCALKMSTGLYSAFVCSELALHDKVVDTCDGLSEKDVDYSIRNLGRLGHDGMEQTDDMVLDIMTHKQL